MEKYAVFLFDYDDDDEEYSEVFMCQADDVDHAREQAADAYPCGIITAVYKEVLP